MSTQGDSPEERGESRARSVRIRGTGTVEVAAFGIADAEHLIEKEISRLLPGARVEITAVRRRGEARIVEEFTADYRIELKVSVEDTGNPIRLAFQCAMDAVAGSRYARTSWDRVTPTSP